MELEKQILLVPALLIIPGMVLFAYFLLSKEFYEYEKWNTWSGYASLLFIIVSPFQKRFGCWGVKLVLLFISASIVLLGVCILLLVF
jgi:hypothetical protein